VRSSTSAPVRLLTVISTLVAAIALGMPAAAAAAPSGVSAQKSCGGFTTGSSWKVTNVMVSGPDSCYVVSHILTDWYEARLEMQSVNVDGWRCSSTSVHPKKGAPYLNWTCKYSGGLVTFREYSPPTACKSVHDPYNRADHIVRIGSTCAIAQQVARASFRAETTYTSNGFHCSGYGTLPVYWTCRKGTSELTFQRYWQD
jgi:hypothetical protein